MNKLLLIVGTIFVHFSAMSQTVIKETDGVGTRFIPGAYMKSGKSAIYFSSDEYGYWDDQTKYEAEIYDFDLNLIKSFYFEILEPYTETEQRATNGTKELTKIIKERRNEILGLPDTSDMTARKREFISWVYENNMYLDHAITLEGLTADARIEGSMVYITMPKWAIYTAYPEYLKSLEIYFDESNSYGYVFTYATQVPVCNGEWSKVTWYDVPVSNFCTPKCIDVESINHWNAGVYLPFSQTFFNDDEKFEYVRYTTEIVKGGGYDNIQPNPENPLKVLFGITVNDRDGDGEEDYRSTYYGVKRMGIEVVSEDGNTIWSFPLPQTCEGDAGIQFFKSDNHILAQIDFDWRDENDRYMHTARFYRLDKLSGTPMVIKEENRMAVSPNPVSKGIPIRVYLPDELSIKGRITVTSLNGVQVYTDEIDCGIKEAIIPTRDLTSGMYILNITEGEIVKGTCKIIVR